VAKRTTPLAERAQGFFDLLAEEHRPVAEGKARAIPLEQILPDFEQPRRVLPDDLYQALRAGEIQPRQAMTGLVRRAEAGDLVARLILGEDAEMPDDSSLRALAASIRQVGLRQPPTVYTIRKTGPGQPGYRIAEGERRYWAHHLLVLEGHEEFAQMPCLIETLPDDPLLVRARQVAENAMRRGLSAIARARAFAEVKKAIEQELSGTRVPEKSYVEGEKGELSGTRVPEKYDSREGRGRPRLNISSHKLDDLVAQRVGAVNGRPVSGRLVRNYLRLLTLPVDVQELADAANLTEGQLRHLFKLDDRPDLQLEVTHKIIAEKLSAREVQTLAEDIARRGAPACQAVRSRVKRNTPQDRLRQVTRSGLRIREQLQQQEEGEDSFYYDLLTTEEYQDIRESILEFHEWLTAIVERLQNVENVGASLPAHSRYGDETLP